MKNKRKQNTELKIREKAEGKRNGRRKKEAGSGGEEKLRYHARHRQQQKRLQALSTHRTAAEALARRRLD